MTRFWVKLWWYARKRAVAALADGHPSELEEARRAWRRGAQLGGDLSTPAWNTRGLADDLALHDAADSLLGEHA